jgi:hypothetical protein
MVGIATVGLFWGLGTAWGAVPNANSIVCPKAPAGWTTPPGVGGRTVRSPNPLDATPGSTTYLLGTTQVQLLCGYTSSSGELFKVAVNYALPVADYNPFADFDLGCVTKFNTANGDLAWNSTKRVYRVVSLSAWSYASFVDPYDQITESDVAPFEAIAQTLLKESLPASHPCTLPGHGKATAVPSKTWGVEFSVQIEAATGTGFDIPPRQAPSTDASFEWNGAFLTKPSLTGRASDVVGLEFPDFTMGITSGGCAGEAEAACLGAISSSGCQNLACEEAKGVAPPPITTQLVTFHFGTSALVFKYTPGASTTIEVPVSVTSSNYAPCSVGSTGTLTLTQLLPLQQGTPKDVVLDACGSTDLLPSTPNPNASPLVSVLFTAP